MAIMRRMTTPYKLDPAHTIVQLLGGRTYVAVRLDIDQSTVARWMYPKNIHCGTGGQIPQKYWHKFLAMGRENGLKITVEDLAGFE